MMASFLPSEIARLILGYLKSVGCMKSYSTFLAESPYLAEYRTLLEQGQEFPTKIAGKCLTDMLEEYGQLKICDSSVGVSEVWGKFDKVVSQLRNLKVLHSSSPKVLGVSAFQKQRMRENKKKLSQFKLSTSFQDESELPSHCNGSMTSETSSPQSYCESPNTYCRHKALHSSTPLGFVGEMKSYQSPIVVSDSDHVFSPDSYPGTPHGDVQESPKCAANKSSLYTIQSISKPTNNNAEFVDYKSQYVANSSPLNQYSDKSVLENPKMKAMTLKERQISALKTGNLSLLVANHNKLPNSGKQNVGLASSSEDQFTKKVENEGIMKKNIFSEVHHQIAELSEVKTMQNIDVNTKNIKTPVKNIFHDESKSDYFRSPKRKSNAPKKRSVDVDTTDKTPVKVKPLLDMPQNLDELLFSTGLPEQLAEAINKNLLKSDNENIHSCKDTSPARDVTPLKEKRSHLYKSASPHVHKVVSPCNEDSTSLNPPLSVDEYHQLNLTLEEDSKNLLNEHTLKQILNMAEETYPAGIEKIMNILQLEDTHLSAVNSESPARELRKIESENDNCMPAASALEHYSSKAECNDTLNTTACDSPLQSSSVTHTQTNHTCSVSTDSVSTDPALANTLAGSTTLLSTVNTCTKLITQAPRFSSSFPVTAPQSNLPTIHVKTVERTAADGQQKCGGFFQLLHNSDHQTYIETVEVVDPCMSANTSLDTTTSFDTNSLQFNDSKLPENETKELQKPVNTETSRFTDSNSCDGVLQLPNGTTIKVLPEGADINSQVQTLQTLTSIKSFLDKGYNLIPLDQNQQPNSTIDAQHIEIESSTSHKPDASYISSSVVQSPKNYNESLQTLDMNGMNFISCQTKSEKPSKNKKGRPKKNTEKKKTENKVIIKPLLVPTTYAIREGKNRVISREVGKRTNRRNCLGMPSAILSENKLDANVTRGQNIISVPQLSQISVASVQSTNVLSASKTVLLANEKQNTFSSQTTVAPNRVSLKSLLLMDKAAFVNKSKSSTLIDKEVSNIEIVDTHVEKLKCDRKQSPSPTRRQLFANSFVKTSETRSEKKGAKHQYSIGSMLFSPNKPKFSLTNSLGATSAKSSISSYPKLQKTTSTTATDSHPKVAIPLLSMPKDFNSVSKTSPIIEYGVDPKSIPSFNNKFPNITSNEQVLSKPEQNKNSDNKVIGFMKEDSCISLEAAVEIINGTDTNQEEQVAAETLLELRVPVVTPKKHCVSDLAKSNEKITICENDELEGKEVRYFSNITDEKNLNVPILTKDVSVKKLSENNENIANQKKVKFQNNEYQCKASNIHNLEKKKRVLNSRVDSNSDNTSDIKKVRHKVNVIKLKSPQTKMHKNSKKLLRETSKNAAEKKHISPPRSLALANLISLGSEALIHSPSAQLPVTKGAKLQKRKLSLGDDPTQSDVKKRKVKVLNSSKRDVTK